MVVFLECVDVLECIEFRGSMAFIVFSGLSARQLKVSNRIISIFLKAYLHVACEYRTIIPTEVAARRSHVVISYVSILHLNIQALLGGTGTPWVAA